MTFAERSGISYINDAAHTKGDAMEYIVDAVITNNHTGRSTRKTFKLDAKDADDAAIKALDLKGGAESMTVIRAHIISDFTHPL